MAEKSLSAARESRAPQRESRSPQGGAPGSFHDRVAIPFQLYNSLFLTLPFETIHETGTLLPLLSRACEAGYEKKYAPQEILRRFRKEHLGDIDDKGFYDLLFQFIQYVERQVVLFDALEDAAFEQLNELDGPGTVPALKDKAGFKENLEGLAETLKDFRLRIVLTAHPTQFYPAQVLGIITDLEAAIRDSDIGRINDLLLQLGKTPFYHTEKPTPLDEAVRLIWYLENVFYDAIPQVLRRVADALSASGETVDAAELAHLVQMGFWPGGDRDGNPFVEASVTVEVARRLRQAVLRAYREDIRRLRRRLTFKGVDPMVQAVEERIVATMRGTKGAYRKADELLAELDAIRAALLERHNGLFADRLDDFRTKVKAFGFHFATLDIRQDSRIHGKVLRKLLPGLGLKPAEYDAMTPEARLDWLANVSGEAKPAKLDDAVERDVLEALTDLRTIQKENGVAGCHRYIISNCRGAENVLEVMALARLVGWKGNLPLDIVPLFETVDDLAAAPQAMRTLYAHKDYRKHLRSRGKRQTVMLGFSDGTKDGGYLQANWSIYRAKEELTAASREAGMQVVFFDGRGGPPARGGGNTHRFYASLGPNIEGRSLELTVQGQTISSNFGTVRSAAYNIEQLLSAGIEHNLYAGDQAELGPEQRELLEELAERSFEAYRKLKEDPDLLPYLKDLGTLEYYAETNIGSRPAKRKGALTLDSLRAIPFVGTWNQMKQNVPGFYGLGTAMQPFERHGELNRVADLYRDSPFFRALCDNAMMALAKTFFPLTRHLSKHPQYGAIWKRVHKEYQETRRLLLTISNQPELMANTPTGQASVQLREQIVLPLLTIQQFALACLRGEEEIPKGIPRRVFRRMVVRSMYGIINAGRNSA